MAKTGRKTGTPKTGGRKKGTPNKRSNQLLDVLEAAGYDPEKDNPLVWMLRVYTGEVTMPVVCTEITINGPVAVVNDVPLEPALRVRCMTEFAQYIYPKRKAIEVSGPDGGEIPVTAIIRKVVDPKNKPKAEA